MNGRITSCKRTSRRPILWAGIFLALSTGLVAAQTERPPEAINRYRAGFDMLKARDMRNAAIEFEEAVKADSTYGDAHYALGKVFIALEQYDKAIASYVAARRHGVSNEKARRTLDAQLAEIYYKAALKARGLRRYRDAIAAFEQSLELKPGNARAYYGLGLCYGSLRETPSARKAFQKVINLDAGYVRAFVALGDMHRQQREFRQAADMYTRALSADPKFMAAHAGLALVRMDTDDLEGAVTTLRDALKADPEFAYGHLLLGTALSQLGRHSEAIEPLERAVDLDASVAEAHYRLGEALYGTGEYRPAVEACRQAIRLERNYHAAEVILGDSYAKLGQVDEARTWYTKARTDSRFRDYCEHQLAELDRPRQTTAP